METPVLNTLYYLSRPPANGQGIDPVGQQGHQVLSRVFPALNFSSTCYFIGQGLPEDRSFFRQVLDQVCLFLKKNPFLQMSLRPVHTLHEHEAEAWKGIYDDFFLACRPFHEEGYREQIVSRLRIFPLVYFSGPEEVRKARPLLGDLKNRFFLSSLLLPCALAERRELLTALQGQPEWERIYFTKADEYVPLEILETLVFSSQMDVVLEDESLEVRMNRGPLCQGSLILTTQGTIRACLQEHRESTLLLPGKSPKKEGEEQSDQAGEWLPGVDRETCLDCLMRMLEHTAPSFKANQRLSSLQELSERIATFQRKHGRNHQALQAWNICVQNVPPGETAPHVRVHRGLSLYENGDLEEAMTELTLAREVLPDSPLVRYYMGLCEFGWRDYIEAADRFSEAILLGLEHPLSQDAEYFRGESHYHIEEYDEALEALARAQAAGRKDSPLYFYQGLSRLGKGEPDKALSFLLEALSCGPAPDDLFHVLFYIAHAFKETEAYSKALEYCERAEKINTNSYELFNLKGFCYFKMGQHDHAIQSFEKCLQMNPDSAIDYANIGSNLRDKGDLEGAVGMYRKALSLDGNIDFARDSLNRLEKKIGKATP